MRNRGTDGFPCDLIIDRMEYDSVTVVDPRVAVGELGSGEESLVEYGGVVASRLGGREGDPKRKKDLLMERINTLFFCTVCALKQERRWCI